MQIKPYLTDNCIIVFDELVNYPGFENGELKAFYEFVSEHGISYKWLGMNGKIGDILWISERVAVILNLNKTEKCESCDFAKHPLKGNNGNTHCCLRCKLDGSHGPFCQQFKMPPSSG